MSERSALSFCKGDHNWRGKKGLRFMRRLVRDMCEEVPKEWPFRTFLAIDFQTDYQ